MIKINLLKQRPVIHGMPTEKDGVRLVLTVLLIVIVSAIGTGVIIKKVKSIPVAEGQKPFVNSEVREVATHSELGTSEHGTDSEKSSSENDTLYTRYSDMGMAQRLTYEHLYAYYLFRELALIVPSDVDFSSISMKGYETIVGLGGIKTQESTIALFSSLKKKEWDLEPKPASLFREYNDGYQFRFEGLYKITPSALDSLVITESSIPTQDHLQELKDSVTAIVSRVPVKVTGEMHGLDPVIEGKFTHYQYVLHGQSSFTQFKDLLKEIKNSSSPLSISDAELNASGSGLAWVITVRITVL